jgi:hypothetical protein
MEETFKYRKPDMLMISIQSHKRVVDAENMVSSIARSLMVRSFYSGYSTITLVLWLSRIFYKVPYGYLPPTGDLTS